MRTNQQPNSPRQAAGAPPTTGFTLNEIYLYSYSLNSYYYSSKNRGISSLYGGAGVPFPAYPSVTGVLHDPVPAAMLQEKSNCLVNRLWPHLTRRLIAAVPGGF